MKVGWCDAAPTYREYDVTLRRATTHLKPL
jgi:hypothetical protein